MKDALLSPDIRDFLQTYYTGEILQSVPRENLHSASLCQWLAQYVPDLLESREELEKMTIALNTTQKTLEAKGRLCGELEAKKVKAVVAQKIADDILRVVQEELEREREEKKKLEDSVKAAEKELAEARRQLEEQKTANVEIKRTLQ